MPPFDPVVASPSGACAARVDGVEGDIGANRLVGSRHQLRLVVNAVEAKPAGEVDERLLLVDRSKHLYRRLQRGQLAIGVENVELGVVLPESRGGVRGAFVVGVLLKALAQAEDQRAEHFLKLCAVAGEVLLDAHGAAGKGHDGHDVRWLHLRGDELLRGAIGSQLIGGRHDARVKVQNQQAVVAVA